MSTSFMNMGMPDMKGIVKTITKAVKIPSGVSKAAEQQDSKDDGKKVKLPLMKKKSTDKVLL
jgi:hypothetical protein